MYYFLILLFALGLAPEGAIASSACADSIMRSLDGEVASDFIWADPTKTEHEPGLPRDFTDQMEKEGAVSVTLGGSSLTGNLRGRGTYKYYFRDSPKTPEELAKMIVDVAEPELKAMARAGRFENGDAPIFILPTPGLVQDHGTVILPGNYGALATSHPGGVDLSRLVPEEIARRAASLGIPEAQLRKTRVFAENDALPVVANAVHPSHELLRPDETATVYFAGTGTGAAKIRVGGENALREMHPDEEGHLKAGEAVGLFPFHVRLGSLIANSKSRIPVEDTWARQRELELENLSAGGRRRSETAPDRTHLSGANSVALSFLLDRLPDWVLSRIDGNPAQLKAAFAASLRSKSYSGMREALRMRLRAKGLPRRKIAELSADATAHADELRDLGMDSGLIEDMRLLELLRKRGSLSTKDISEAAAAGSPLARRMVSDDTYSQGLVGGLIALNVGPAPAPGKVIPPDLVFGNGQDRSPEVKLLVRPTASLSSWADPRYFPSAAKGVRDAKNFLLKDPDYKRNLERLGYSNLTPERVTIKLQLIPDSGVHPDVQGMDHIARQLRQSQSDDPRN